jgi:transcriptional regulator with XRE-family HTH domain
MRENDLAKIVGAAIAARRRQRNMTQEELAGILDITTDTLSRMEKGRFAPKMGRLPEIARALHCSIADLFREADAQAADRASTIAEILKPLPDKAQEALVELMRRASEVMLDR